MSEKPFPYTEELLVARRKRKETERDLRGIFYGALGTAALLGSIYLVGAKGTDKPSNPEKAKSTKEITVGSGGEYPTLAGAVLGLADLNPGLNRDKDIRPLLGREYHGDQFKPGGSVETLNVPSPWNTGEQTK